MKNKWEDLYETYDRVSVYTDATITSEARQNTMAPRGGPPSASFK